MVFPIIVSESDLKQVMRNSTMVWCIKIYLINLAN